MQKKLYLLLAFAVLGVIQAAIFLALYSSVFEPYSFWQCLVSLLYSVPQSLMVAAWLMLLPFVLGFVYVWIRGDWHRRFMIGYLTLCSVPLFMLCLLDWGLYGFWGFRLDCTPFIYVFDDPIEAAKETPVVLGILTPLLTIGLTWLMYKLMKLVYPKRRSGSITRMNTGAAQMREGLWNLVLAVASLVVGQGCFGLMGMESAYHTDQQPLNHVATNPVYSLFHSICQQCTPLDEQYRFMSDEERQSAMNELSALAQAQASAQAADSTLQPAGPTSLLREGVMPNVLLLMIESLSGTACPYLYADAPEGVMPNVCQAMAEGVAFTQCYANSFRTERGMVSILSAFPGQPTYSVMNDAARRTQLPHLASALADAGYSLEFVTGGDGKFCGLPEYLSAAGFNRRVDREHFPSEQYDCKWGMHDAFMYDYLLDRLREEAALASDTLAEYAPQPYFKAMMTVSSHEPFVVPSNRFEDPYLNSVAYTDSCLGAFLNELRADASIWDHLLVIGLADHAYANYPEGIGQHEPRRYHIPMFWTGGAVAGHVDVPVMCQQTDLTATLLRQLGIQADGFGFSHDVMQADAPHFAFYAWPDGFGLLTDSCRYIQDNHYDAHPLPGSDDPTGRAQRLGKAYLQTVYDSLSRLLEH